MAPSKKKEEQVAYYIGIDLGTTHSSLSYVRANAGQETSREKPVVETLSISQLQEDGTLVSSPILPSFLYFPTAEEKLSFPEIGNVAQKKGEEIPGRVISSAKSWLCHEGVDRRSPFLPLGEDLPSEHKISPQKSLSLILEKLKSNWDEAFSDAPFIDQKVFVTVPASFDPAAQQLVLEAAREAGYPPITLLEEPLAAFYAWLQKHQETWRSHLKVGDSVLVVDIGGGTTDFTLVDVSEEQGNLVLKRSAVGSHLLLGGDNIDHLLAYLAQEQLQLKGSTLTEWQFQSLVHVCRKAKEQLFGENPPKSLDITILGRGSKLIGGSLKTTLELAKVQSAILDGFFPLLSRKELAIKEKRAGITQLGLPFVRDARITAQLATFLQGRALPTKVLFNGGTMKSVAFRDRMMQLLNQWSENSVEELQEANYDFAVSLGAVCYALANQGHSIRIRSGVNKSYYVGIEDTAPAVPGVTPKIKKICIAPMGMEEGSEAVLETQEFSLWVGELVTFRFYSRSGEEQFGNYLSPEHESSIEELHPIETVLPQEGIEGKTVPIKISSKVTELGFLELWCQSSKEQKWKLEFNLRSEP